jgi:hypothetical protein
MNKGEVEWHLDQALAEIMGPSAMNDDGLAIIKSLPSDLVQDGQCCARDGVEAVLVLLIYNMVKHYRTLPLSR